MKHLRVATMIVACLIGCIFIAVSCDKKETQEQDGITLTEKANDSGNSVCCSVSCSKGSCNAYGPGSCSCTCSLTGRPKCSNISAISVADEHLFDGRVHVTLSPTILQQTKELQDLLYSFNKDYATAVADKHGEFKNIVDNYGYELTTKNAVLAYYDILEFEDNYVSQFTTEEVEAIEELVAKENVE
ncbi:MAG: hypothetical protein J6V54_10315 [Bacteroidales bacterium]|nr:hypothetical protein [Bacteroidales bacterium]